MTLAAYTPMMTVLSGSRVVGFLIGRGREGVEAFDRDERSLGVFQSPIEAATAVEKTADEERR